MLASTPNAWEYKYMLAEETIVITGASSGFGEAFAEEMAKRAVAQNRAQSTRILLIARSVGKLQTLANKLQEQYDCCAEALPCDLASKEQRTQLLTKLQALSSDSMWLINNAGLGDYGEFITAEPERNTQMLEVNITAPVEITRCMLPAMAEAKKAYIINIASLAADLAIPDFAMYAASKAFVASFSEALRLELKKTHIHVTAVCPGPVHTAFGDVARRSGSQKKEVPFRKWFYTSIPCVVTGAIKAVQKNKARFYPSLKIRLAGLFVRCAPLWLLRAIMGRRPRKAIPTAES